MFRLPSIFAFAFLVASAIVMASAANVVRDTTSDASTVQQVTTSAGTVFTIPTGGVGPVQTSAFTSTSTSDNSGPSPDGSGGGQFGAANALTISPLSVWIPISASLLLVASGATLVGLL